MAHDTETTIHAARDLHNRIDQPNLFVKIPATVEGVPAIRAMIAEGLSVNTTLIFSLSRYRQVIDAYLAGLEEYARAGGDVSGCWWHLYLVTDRQVLAALIGDVCRGMPSIEATLSADRDDMAVDIPDG